MQGLLAAVAGRWTCEDSSSPPLLGSKADRRPRAARSLSHLYEIIRNSVTAREEGWEYSQLCLDPHNLRPLMDGGPPSEIIHWKCKNQNNPIGMQYEGLRLIS